MDVHDRADMSQFEWYRDNNKVITVSSICLGRFYYAWGCVRKLAALLHTPRAAGRGKIPCSVFTAAGFLQRLQMLPVKWKKFRKSGKDEEESK